MFDYYIPMDKYYMYYLKDLNKPEISIESSPYNIFSTTKSYLDKYPDNKNYVPQLSSSLESLLPDQKTSGNDVSDIIMQEKQQFLGVSVQHFKGPVEFEG